MAVPIGVLFAFLGTGGAGDGARLHLTFEALGIRFRLSRDKAARGHADVRTVEVRADAADEHLDLIFRQAGVRAGRAGLAALITGIDTFGHQGRVQLPLFGVRFQHFLNVTHSLAPYAVFGAGEATPILKNSVGSARGTLSRK